jgi:hypothetical protein
VRVGLEDSLYIRPGELALSRSVLAKLPPRPPGYPRTRELFPRYTGGAFDPIMPAVVAADMTVGFILTNDRAARMVAQKAVDPALPGLAEVLDRIVATAYDAPAATAYEAEIKRAIQEVVVGRIIDPADTAPMAQVRAIASQKLKAIQRGRAERRRQGDAGPGYRRHRASIGPTSPRVIASPGTPPGAPIGDTHELPDGSRERAPSETDDHRRSAKGDRRLAIDHRGIDAVRDCRSTIHD